MKLPEPYTFFVDRALGGKVVVGALQSAGYTAIAGDSRFAQDAPDIEWLPVVGSEQWVLLTKDRAIRSNQLERELLLRNNVAAFMLGAGNVSGPAMARIFLEAMRTMQAVLRRFHVPFIATVTKSATVNVLWANENWLRPPVTMKPRGGGSTQT